MAQLITDRRDIEFVLYEQFKAAELTKHEKFADFNPISRLANQRLCHGLEMDEDNLESAFTMAWDAIKL